MVQWWLNYKWASEAYADPLARIDVAVVLVGITMLVGIVAGG